MFAAYPSTRGHAMQRYATALRSNDLAQRRAAVRALAELGPAIPLPAIDSLLGLLQDPDETIRDGAAEALLYVARSVGAGQERVIRGLGELLRHPEDLWRLRAVGIISRVGPPAAALIPQLVMGLKDRNRVLCRVAAEALCRIGPAAMPALEAAQADPACRPAARWALNRMSEAHDDTVDTVLHAKQQTAPAISVPTPMPDYDIPARPTGRERRRDRRYPCTREVFYQLMSRKGQDLWWNARIVDVSVGGIRLLLTRSVTVGDRVAIDLREAHDGVERNAVARIVHARVTDKGWNVGCAWLGPLTIEELALLREPDK